MDIHRNLIEFPCPGVFSGDNMKLESEREGGRDDDEIDRSRKSNQIFNLFEIIIFFNLVFHHANTFGEIQFSSTFIAIR